MKVLSFGAVLWDIIKNQECIGGAPFNLAAHLAQCGAQTAMMTRVGQDRLGERARQEISRLGVDGTLVQVDSLHPTGWAKVELDEQGVPTFEFPPNPAYNFIECEPASLQRVLAEEFDVICFGTLEQKGDVTRQSLQRLLDSTEARHVFYDVNIRLDFYPESILRECLEKSTIVKLNSDEASLLCRRLYHDELSEEPFVKRLCSDYPVEVVCVTKGPDGCTVYAGRKSYDSTAPRVKVADTVGSGDAFGAGFLYEYCRGKSPLESAQTANVLGAFVASLRGAIPQYSDEIRKLLE